jgi:hypothetical protein
VGKIKSRGGKLLKVTSADLMTTEENKTRKKKKQHHRPYILHRDTMQQEYSPAGPATEYIYTPVAPWKTILNSWGK